MATRNGVRAQHEGNNAPPPHMNIVNLLPTFEDKEGEKIEFFLSQFEQISSMAQLSTQQKGIILKSKLKGQALQFLTANTMLQEETDFEKIKKIMLDRFKRKTTITQEHQLFKSIRHVPGTSIADLAHKIQITATKFLKTDQADTAQIADIIDRICLSKFLEVIREDIRIDLLKQSPLNFKDAVQKAELLENIAEESTERVNAIKQYENTLASKLDVALKEGNTSHNINNNQQNQKPVCLACGQNHFMIACEFLKRTQQQMANNYQNQNYTQGYESDRQFNHPHRGASGNSRDTHNYRPYDRDNQDRYRNSRFGNRRYPRNNRGYQANYNENRHNLN